MPSFDIVSKVQTNEVDNALAQAQKEIAQRYDFKDTESSIERTKEGVSIRSSSEERAKAVLGVFQEKLIKRKVSLSFLDAKDPEHSGKTWRIAANLKEGIEPENARKIVAAIKDAKMKVQAAIQGDQLRVTGKNRDDLQGAIALARGLDLGIELQFVNFRD
jgi:uncharacterized protein YajQ (UPF0234 family)